MRLHTNTLKILLSAIVCSVLTSIAFFVFTSSATVLAESHGHSHEHTSGADSGRTSSTADVTRCSEQDAVCVEVSEDTLTRTDPTQAERSRKPRKKQRNRFTCRWYELAIDWENFFQADQKLLSNAARGLQLPGVGWIRQPSSARMNTPSARLERVYKLQDSHSYILDCVYRGTDKRLQGYPQVRVYHERDYTQSTTQGTPATTQSVRNYARNLLQLEQPQTLIWPPRKQLVGVETWLAVTSPLKYAHKSAQVGNTWATVKASFKHVDWDFGVHGQVRCVADANKRWNPALPSNRQHSACTKVFEAVPTQGSQFNATVTVTWDIYWSSSGHTGWKHYTEHSLTSTLPIHLFDIQSAIL